MLFLTRLDLQTAHPLRDRVIILRGDACMLACRPDRALMSLIQVLSCGFVTFQFLVRGSDFRGHASGAAVEVPE